MPEPIERPGGEAPGCLADLRSTGRPVLAPKLQTHFSDRDEWDYSLSHERPHDEEEPGER